MKKQIFLIALYSCLLLLVSRCAHSKSDSEYVYSEQFIKYTSEVHGFTPQKGRVYYLIDMFSCDPCINANLRLLSELEKNENLEIIYINRPRFNTWNSQIEDINKKFNYLTDTGGEANLFELGLFKPLLLVFGENEVKDFMNISDFEIEKARRFLDQHLNN